MTKRLQLFSILCSIAIATSAQIVSLQECQEWARVNFPLFKQKALLQQHTETTLSILNTKYLPQIQVGGEASYQSDVTQLDIQLPEGLPTIETPTIDKDQYNLYAEIYQLLYDGGKNKIQKQMVKNKNAIQEQEIEVKIDELLQQVNRTFFGILLIKEQKKLLTLLQKDLQIAAKNINALAENGIVLQTEVKKITVEQLKIKQQKNRLAEKNKTLVSILALLTGRELSSKTEFQTPHIIQTQSYQERPNIQLIERRMDGVILQQKELSAQLIPNLNLFARGGYGKPALNLFSNKFEPYYIAGMQLSWRLSQWYTYSSQRRNIEREQQMLHWQREAVRQQNELDIITEKGHIDQLKKNIQIDNDIIALRHDIKKNSATQLKNGVITSTEFIQIANAENQARQNKAIHQVQLSMAQYQLQWYK